MKRAKFIFLWITLIFNLAILNAESPTKTVLWLGTSIPAGCTYPDVSTRNLQMRCINKSVPSSFLSAWVKEQNFDVRCSGLSLTMSCAEKETAFRPYVESGKLTEEQLDYWKSTSYDMLVQPYINDVDIVVIDHGYNDNYSVEKLYLAGEEHIDWNSRDRSNFIGAFNFLYDLIKRQNPDVIVLIGGYFQNTCTIDYFQRGIWVSTVLSWIADRYHLPLLNTWDYTYIPDGYLTDSNDYLNRLNEKYGTSYQKVFSDQKGNITHFQKFCPDGVHPFSDLTGQSDKLLDDIFTSLLKRILCKETPNCH